MIIACVVLAILFAEFLLIAPDKLPWNRREKK